MAANQLTLENRYVLVGTLGWLAVCKRGERSGTSMLTSTTPNTNGLFIGGYFSRIIILLLLRLIIVHVIVVID